MRWRSFGLRGRLALLCSLCACNDPFLTTPDPSLGDGGTSPDLNPGRPGFYDDFPKGPLVLSGLPADIAEQFQQPSGADLAGPCLLEPALGALYPRNFTPPLFEWRGAPEANVFELRLHVANQTNDLLVYSPDNRFSIPRDTWLRLALHSAGRDITITLRAAQLEPSTRRLRGAPALGSSGAVTIAEVEAPGAVVYWTTSGGSALKGFLVGELEPRTVLTPPQMNDGTRCVGCHVSSPDGRLAFLSRTADPDANLPISVDARRVDGSALAASSAEISDAARELLARPNQTLPTLSRSHYSANDAVALTMLSDSSTRNRWEIVWTDLRAATVAAGSGIVAREGDARPAANPTFSQDGRTVAYVSTTQVTDGRVRKAPADIYTVPYNDRKGGPAAPLSGAADPLYSEYYPVYSPEDRLLAFNRVSAGSNMYNEPTAEVFVLPGRGGTPVRVAGNDPPACSDRRSPGITNSWPRWAPGIGRSGDLRYYWLVFSSTRRGALPQLYVAGVRTRTDELQGEVVDKTYPAVYVSSQNPAESNHTPAWDEFKLIIE